MKYLLDTISCIWGSRVIKKIDMKGTLVPVITSSSSLSAVSYRRLSTIRFSNIAGDSLENRFYKWDRLVLDEKGSLVPVAPCTAAQSVAKREHNAPTEFSGRSSHDCCCRQNYNGVSMLWLVEGYQNIQVPTKIV